MELKKSLFTRDELQDLREEFIEFQINEMRPEDMASFIRNQMLKEYNCYSENMLRQEIDDYDEYLYEILAKYVKNQEGSYEEMQEFIIDRNSNNWIEN